MALLVPFRISLIAESILAGAGRHEATLYTKAGWNDSRNLHRGFRRPRSKSIRACWGRPMDQMTIAAAAYRALCDRIRAEDPQIDEQTLADTVEGLTDLHEIVTAIIRSALADEALATGLKGRIAEMQDRLDRLQDRASKRRQIAKDVMVELDLKKITAPDFTVSIRPGMPALLVLDEAAVPSIYWEPRDPRLNRQSLLSDLKEGADIKGVALSNPEPVLSVRTR